MSSSLEDQLRQTIRDLPHQPGVYRFFDRDDRLLYVGKAKNLKKRVSSYFNGMDRHPGRIRVMVSKIRRIEFTVVNTEFDALLLENSLIKKHQPRYNVNLRDDKTYPYIVIKNEPFPRVFPTRQRIADGSEYFGPFASVHRMNTILDLIKKLYPLRSCHYDLKRENIEAGKFRVCLDYHIGLCKGPCEGLQSKEEYDANVAQIRKILKGQTQQVHQHLKADMQAAVEKLDFEQAEALRQKQDILEQFQFKSTVVSTTVRNVDVYGVYTQDARTFVHYMKVKNGAIIQTDTFEYVQQVEEAEEDILLMAVVESRERFQSDSQEVILPIETDFDGGSLTFICPQQGEKKQLLNLARKNAFYYAKERQKAIAQAGEKRRRRQNKVLEQLQQDLRLPELPEHIECFDNSNFQGSYPVSSCVVFKDGKPAKSEYRIFKVKHVQQIDDFGTMKEVVYRRYRRLLDEGRPLPQLIIIDGGKGQLHAAVESLQELALLDRIPVVGIAKRLEEIYKPGDPYPLHIDKKSDSLRLIQRARDEAHRFAITFHRKQRSKGTFNTELENIPGIGQKTAKLLLKSFGSAQAVFEASEEALEEVLGPAKTRKIQDYLQQRTAESST